MYLGSLKIRKGDSSGGYVGYEDDMGCGCKKLRKSGNVC